MFFRFIVNFLSLPRSLYLLLAISCSSNFEDLNEAEPSIKATKSKLEKINKTAVEIEDIQIQRYLDRRGLIAQKTATGVRYIITKKGKGKKIKSNNRVAVSYKLYLLDGKLCYQTEKGKQEIFSVDKSEVENGLHEAIKLLVEGDEAVIVIPSYLAHGITGDLEKIPPRTTIIYKIIIIKVL